MADETYAELCVVPASSAVKIPEGQDVVEAAALPLVTTTGNQLIVLGTVAKAGQKVLITGAAGSVGRSAVFTAKERGAFVIAGVRKNQLRESEGLGANQVVAIDDNDAIANLPPLDAVADTVDGETAERLIAKVKPGGLFASVLGTPQNRDEYPAVNTVSVFAKADAKVLLYMAQAVARGSLKIPVGAKFSLKDAGKSHAAVAHAVAGKVLLLSDRTS